MSEITWAELTEDTQEALKTIASGKRPDPFMALDLEKFELIEITPDNIKITDLGRAVLAQADSGITGAKNAQVEAGDASDAVALARAQIARLRSALEAIHDYPVVAVDMDLDHQVADMAMLAGVALDEYPPESGLLTILANKLSAAQAELASAKAEAGRLRTAACKAEELRQIWLKKSEITNAAYDVLQASDRPYDARTKEYKAHDTLSKESQRALWSFQDAIRNIGNSVWQSYLADQRKQAAALQAGTEGG